MTRRGRRANQAKEREGTTSHGGGGDGTPRRRSRVIPAVTAAVLVVGAAGTWWVSRSTAGLRGGLAELAPPRVSAPTRPVVRLEDFVGPDACEECHAEQVEKWRGSTHGRAGGLPAPEVVIAPFDGTPIRFRDALVIPSMDSRGRYTFTVEEDGREPLVLAVDGVVGGGHMVGGGTQGFVSEREDGTIRFLPFDFIRQEGVWFCNTNTRTDEGWVPITPDMPLAACADWPLVRILGTDGRYANCQECHTALTDLVFDTAAERFSTRVASYAIECESCHGPMAEHVERSDSTRVDSEPDLAVQAYATLTEDGSLAICFRCHALKDVMQPGYLPGKPFDDHYSIGLPMLADQALFPDGRVRTFAYQENHRYSDCYLNGSMTCVDCHDPHSQDYRDIWGRPLPDRFDDGQCTDCHASKAEDPEAHTFHEPGTEGSRCVDCHMPFLQHPDLGNELRFSRSDHTIPIPRPRGDDAMGIVNACSQAQCHGDVPLDTVWAWTRDLYGELKPRKPIIEALANPFQIGGEEAGRAVLLDTDVQHPAAQVPALGLFVARYLRPDMGSMDAETEAALRRLAQAPDPDVRAVALAALHFARGNDAEVLELLARTLIAAGDSERALRARWAVALGTFADRYFQAGEWDLAVTSYRKALEIRPGDAPTLRNLGLTQAYAGSFDSAVVSLRASVAADPRDPLAWVNLGFSLSGLGDEAGAEEAYRSAVGVSADEPLAYFNLGNALLRRGDVTGAARTYERALALQPTLTEAYRNLTRAYGGMQDTARVLEVARRWRLWAPDDSEATQLVRDLEAVLGNR